MSMNIVPLQTVQEISPLVDVSMLDKRQYSVYNGGQQITYQQYLAQNVNNSSIQLTTIPPDEKTIIDPKIFAAVVYNLKFVGTSTTGNLIQLGIADSPRAFPLSQTTSTVSASINGQTISTLLNQYFNAAIRYGDNLIDMESTLSTTPIQLDQCTDYSNLFGQNRSPHAFFGENVYQQPRGGFSGIQIVSNTPTAAEINLTVYEPIILPGFYYNKRGLINVRTLNWLFTFQNLNRVWSHDAVNGNNITSLVTNITAFSLWYKFITPKLLENIPKTVVYSYNEIVPSNQSYGSAVASGTQISISMSALNLQAIPKALLIYVRKQDSDLTFNDADSFFRIDNLSINFMNVTGILASAPVQALYQICQENGYIGSWDRYNKYTGAPIMLKLGKDIGLSSLQAPGLLALPQLSMVVRATNISNLAVTPQLFVQCIYEGCLTISDGSMSKSTAVLSNSDVLNAQLSSAKSIESVPQSRNFYGGDLISSIKDFAQDIIKTTRSGIELGTNVAPLIGLGMSGGKRRKKRGGELQGGHMMDRNELMNQQDEYEY